MRLQRYPKYKDTGIGWLGQVPSHWAIDRFKASIEVARNGIWGDEPQGDEGDIACVRVADFDRVRLQVKLPIPTMRSVDLKERTGRVLQRGDLLLEKSGGGELQPVGQVVLFQADMPAVCSNFVARVALKPGMVAGYWNYVHNAAYSVGVNVGSINQTSGIQNLDQDRYFNERAPFPPKPEQVAIAAFLDRETAKIDVLIAEQEKLIALLAEKRHAAITQAVIRGLEPSSPMKDSGVEWLGAVPAHWHIRRMKQLVREGIAGPYGSSLTKSMYTTSGYRVYGQQQVIPDDFTIGDYYISEALFAEMQRYQVKPGDVLVSVMGTIGKAAVVPPEVEPGIINPRLVLYRVHEDLVLPRYLQIVLNGQISQRYFALAAQGTTMEGLNMSSIGELPVAVPPLEEQRALLKHISETTAGLRDLSDQATRAAGLLRERRSALITAAVTGQIDVRGAVQLDRVSPESIGA